MTDDVVPKPESAVPAAAPAPRRHSLLKRLYRWILGWANHPLGTWVLAIIAFLDSSCFLIPPLYLQVALSLERPRRSWWYATVNTMASCAGAAVGYFIGYEFFESVGRWLIVNNGLQTEFDHAGECLAGNAFGFIFVYTLIPFPIKVITIGAGVYHERVSLAMLLLASTLGRGLRFFALAYVCWHFGARAATFIDKYFNWVLAGIGIIAGAVVVLMKLWMGQ